MYQLTLYPEYLVNPRKNWVMTMKSVVTTGETLTGLRNAYQGDPSLSSVRRTLTRGYDESNGETPQRVPGGGQGHEH